jgi:hypothetical protein
MKNLFLVILLFITVSVEAQSEKHEVIVQGLSPKWEISRRITNGVDTVIYFYMGYQNMKYTHITDIGSVVFTRKSDFAAFTEKLWVLADMEKGVDYTDKVGIATLARYPFSRNVYITDRQGKYTYLTKGQISRMVPMFEQYLHLFND